MYISRQSCPGTSCALATVIALLSPITLFSPCIPPSRTLTIDAIMCFSATCPTCSKKSWRGCGSHIPDALAGIPEDRWCTCEPPIMVEGKAYPPAASMELPGLSWLTSWFGGDASKKDQTKGKDEL
ncbi:hypothetical protein F5Y15DRAFT_398979 [Xylariaceae sp. FL0016]|nr:hypothetical protein F5Y15DRAFT_398979 [Xylariaceae sp. FL0016]